ncbi:anthocyanidin reductase ((2S)-flavan-3-ol-forming)-like [Magnolia sinica]|uniref:anthocyanidin reductase ((2S)-flavan-3-ol-forming)-like n=1 Tax=Magnolia sinica TaxID=86752 RepID=UPI00265A8291|nr:anthocyanidin reductase ((2S)-flavan-3-ol-forming)-like [Magnolia sinica]
MGDTATVLGLAFFNSYCFVFDRGFLCGDYSKQYKDAPEAAVARLKSIMGSCLRSGTVKRLIYTASVTAASPLKEDGTGFKDSIHESCWTPLHLAFSYCSNLELDYTCSKTLSEKEALNYCNRENAEMEVVSLACGLVGGDTILPYFPLSMASIISQITSNVPCHRQLRFLQALLGSVPIIPIDDVCDAHVFCMEQPSMSGRFLCVSAYPTIPEIGKCYEEICKDLAIEKE